MREHRKDSITDGDITDVGESAIARDYVRVAMVEEKT